MHSLKLYSFKVKDSRILSGPSCSLGRTPGKRSSVVLGSASIVAAAVDNMLRCYKSRHQMQISRRIYSNAPLRAMTAAERLTAASYLVIVTCVYSLDFRDTQIRVFPSVQRFPATPIRPRQCFPISVDTCGDMLFRSGVAAWIETPAPHPEQQMMMLHCSMHRARGVPLFGREIDKSLQILSFIFGRCGQRSSGLDYVVLVEQIANRRGCGVNGGLRVMNVPGLHEKTEK